MDKIQIPKMPEPILVQEIIRNLSAAELRARAKKDEVTTEYGSPSYISKIKSRSAKFTEIIYGAPNEQQDKIIKDVTAYLKSRRLICVDRQMCLNPQTRLHCRTCVSQDYARLAYMWHETLFPVDASKVNGEPDNTVIDVPEWPERKVLVLPELHLTFILGTDYFGEIKKANLRMAMYIAKRKGWLGLHAASKIIRVKDKSGKLTEKGVIIFGLSGTGKTSLSCHNHGLSGEEGIIIRQDDVVLMRPDGFCFGTEDNFYLKTEGLNPREQSLLYRGATSPNAILENVFVASDGRVDFANYSITSNGRGIVRRSEMKPYTDSDIDLPHADVVIFLARRADIVPPVAKLTPEQGAAFFMLGESVETSAGDPTQAGKSLRVVGTNPFIIGPAEEEGNWFHKMLDNNPRMECFVMNTGRVGGVDGEKITLLDSAEIIKQVIRKSIKWQIDPDWGYQVPASIENLDCTRFDPLHFYSRDEYSAQVRKLKGERREWLRRFAGLDKHIVNAIPE